MGPVVSLVEGLMASWSISEGRDTAASHCRTGPAREDEASSTPVSTIPAPLADASEFAYDPYQEQDLTHYERHYYEDHAYEPERIEL